jgi:hypothetical protein
VPTKGHRRQRVEEPGELLVLPLLVPFRLPLLLPFKLPVPLGEMLPLP